MVAELTPYFSQPIDMKKSHDNLHWLADENIEDLLIISKKLNENDTLSLSAAVIHFILSMLMIKDVKYKIPQYVLTADDARNDESVNIYWDKHEYKIAVKIRGVIFYSTTQATYRRSSLTNFLFISLISKINQVIGFITNPQLSRPLLVDFLYKLVAMLPEALHQWGNYLATQESTVSDLKQVKVAELISAMEPLVNNAIKFEKTADQIIPVKFIEDWGRLYQTLKPLYEELDALTNPNQILAENINPSHLSAEKDPPSVMPRARALTVSHFANNPNPISNNGNRPVSVAPNFSKPLQVKADWLADESFEPLLEIYQKMQQNMAANVEKYTQVNSQIILDFILPLLVLKDNRYRIPETGLQASQNVFLDVSKEGNRYRIAIKLKGDVIGTVKESTYLDASKTTFIFKDLVDTINQTFANIQHPANSHPYLVKFLYRLIDMLPGALQQWENYLDLQKSTLDDNTQNRVVELIGAMRELLTNRQSGISSLRTAAKDEKADGQLLSANFINLWKNLHASIESLYIGLNEISKSSPKASIRENTDPIAAVMPASMAKSAPPKPPRLVKDPASITKFVQTGAASSNSSTASAPTELPLVTPTPRPRSFTVAKKPVDTNDTAATSQARTASVFPSNSRENPHNMNTPPPVIAAKPKPGFPAKPLQQNGNEIVPRN
jgi:hypothetical protein